MAVISNRTMTTKKKRQGAAMFACVSALALATAILGAYCFGGIPDAADSLGANPVRANATALVSHEPIAIEGNDDFTEENGVVGGVGTGEDPYLIAGWILKTNDIGYLSCALRIANTTAVFVITDVLVLRDEYSSSFGIRLVNVTSGTVENCMIEDMYTGIQVESSSCVNITSNSLISSNCAVSLSDNVSISDNEGCDAEIRAFASERVSVVDNRVNYSLSQDYARGLTVDVTSCDQCAIVGNELWGPVETYSWRRSISLSYSTNCTLDGNAMNAPGLVLDANMVHHVSTHAIGGNNTVRMLPLRAYANTEGILIDRADFGQLVISNCTDVRLRDLSLIGLYEAIQIGFCTDIEVSDCTFVNTPSTLDIGYSSDIRVRHNVFENMSEVWIHSCDRVNFSDNLMHESGFYAHRLNASLILDNVFGTESMGETSIISSVNLTLRNNQFSRGGLRYEGESTEEYESISIDESNTGMEGKPILYLNGQSGKTVNLANYSQLLMADCSEIDAHGMTTSSSCAIQIHLSTDVSVHGCKIYGYHPIDLRYADRITFFENDFVNPMSLMHLFMTHNVTTYHCNILGSYGGFSYGGFDNYTPTNIIWDNGYPSGGNYWENLPKEDEYSGPGQDIPGADGISDRPYSPGIGGPDRYPLVAPYVKDQVTQTEGGWQDALLWLGAIAVIVAVSSTISYLLFVREGRQRPGPPSEEDR